MPKRGEKGFTLIELLIVVAILGVLAAVVIPNVGRFIGAGETEAAGTELSNIQTAVVAMMVDNQLSELPTGYVNDSGVPSTDNMSLFPHGTAVVVTVKIKDPNGNAYVEGVDPLGDKAGYILYQHDITGNDSQTALVNYVATGITKGTYYVDASGTVYQKTTGYD
jgi:prepilin-type N-terminal cleavage/methylation domain-containing protein